MAQLQPHPVWHKLKKVVVSFNVTLKKEKLLPKLNYYQALYVQNQSINQNPTSAVTDFIEKSFQKQNNLQNV